MKQNKFLSLLSLLLIIILGTGAIASSCDCHKVKDWNELRTVIMSSTYSATSNKRQTSLPLCPFNIGKYHDSSTNHWSEIIYLEQPIHIYCKKESPSDICAITVTGDACEDNKNCGRQLFKVKSDDVWIQGLTINHAKDVAINIDRKKKNAKLIDMKFVGNEVPYMDNEISAGVVMVENDASLEVLQSTFKWNNATPIYSRGSLLIHDSYFHGNKGSKVLKKGGAIFSKGEVVISKSSFLYNFGGPGGYALYSNNENLLDAGGNCYKSQNNWGCQGVMIQSKCFTLIGDDTICTED